jgi:hypothetical protein
MDGVEFDIVPISQYLMNLRHDTADPHLNQLNKNEFMKLIRKFSSNQPLIDCLSKFNEPDWKATLHADVFNNTDSETRSWPYRHYLQHLGVEGKWHHFQLMLVTITNNHPLRVATAVAVEFKAAIRHMRCYFTGNDGTLEHYTGVMGEVGSILRQVNPDE